MLRFLPSWVDLGSISCGPTSRRLKVADLTLPEGADTLWVRVAQLGGTSPWPFGYGLLSFQSDGGRELGTIKVYGHQEGETYKLTTGLVPQHRAGALWFEPRSYNLKWLETSGATWNLSFSSFAGTSGGTGGGGGDTGGGGGGDTGGGGGGLLAGVIESVHTVNGRYFSSGSVIDGPTHQDYPWSNVFDSDGGSFVSAALGGVSTLLIDPPFPVKSLLSVKAYRDHASNPLKVNGVDHAPGARGTVLIDIPGPTSLSSLTVSYPVSSEQSAIYQVSVDGVPLLDGRQLTRLFLSDSAGLSSLAVGTVISEEGGLNDASGVVASVNVASRSIDLTNHAPDWTVGARVRIAVTR